MGSTLGVNGKRFAPLGGNSSWVRESTDTRRRRTSQSRSAFAREAGFGLDPRPMPHIPVAVIGAGPYGLSLAAHLKARDVESRIFGSPMQTWKRMHPGMGLNSPDFGTNIYTPRLGYTFIEYCASRGLSLAEPLEIARFAQYGLWAQQQLVPQVEDVPVGQVAQSSDGFELALGTGERFQARRVVVAVGLTYFARMPDELAAV